MELLRLLLFTTAFVCFVIAAVGATTSRFNLVAAGLAAWVLVPLIHALVGLGLED